MASTNGHCEVVIERGQEVGAGAVRGIEGKRLHYIVAGD